MLIPGLLSCEREYGQLAGDLARAMRARSLPFAACGLCDGAADAVLASLALEWKREGRGILLVVLPEEKECTRLQRYLSQYGLRAAFYETRDLTFYNITASHEYEHGRLRVLWGLAKGDLDVVLTTPDAALSYTLSPERLLSCTLSLDTQKSVEQGELADMLVGAGYVRVDMVEGAGQFAMRGGIVDIYAPDLHAMTHDTDMIMRAAPVRIEFFGDEIDRMGLFDVETQRIHTMITGCELPPAREVLLTDALRAEIRDAVAAQLKKCKDERAGEELRSEITREMAEVMTRPVSKIAKS